MDLIAAIVIRSLFLPRIRDESGLDLLSLSLSLSNLLPPRVLDDCRSSTVLATVQLSRVQLI